MKQSSFLFVIPALLLLFACDQSTVSGIGGGGTGGTGGTGGEGCHGDEKAWAKITQGPFTCQKSSDCCVVFNGCLSQAQLVRATDYEVAKTAWPYCGDACAGCVAPAVNIACVNGACVGDEVDAEQNADLSQNHCGEDPVTVSTPTATTVFGCGG